MYVITVSHSPEFMFRRQSMKDRAVVIASLVLLTDVTGCSSVGSGLLGGVLGAGAAGGSYEYHI